MYQLTNNNNHNKKKGTSHGIQLELGKFRLHPTCDMPNHLAPQQTLRMGDSSYAPIQSLLLYSIIKIFIFFFQFSPFFLYKLLLQYPQQSLPLPLFPPPPIFSPLLSLCYSVSDQVLGFCLIRSINPNFFFLFPASIRKH